MILEKAWCKLHGSWTRASGGWPHMAFAHLFGMPSQMYFQKDFFKDVDSFWKELCEFDRRSYLLCQSDFDGPNEGAKVVNGIYGGHVYTLLGTIQF